MDFYDKLLGHLQGRGYIVRMTKKLLVTNRHIKLITFGSAPNTC
jgi:hypothetical protein